MLENKPKFNNWAFHTRYLKRVLMVERVINLEGKALGGSSAINAMIYIRGQKKTTMTSGQT